MSNSSRSTRQPDLAAQPDHDAAAHHDDQLSRLAAKRSLAGSTAIMAAGTLVSRILGFVRGATLAAAVAMVGGAADAFDVGNRLPDFFYAILAGGVLNAILVPQIVKAYQGRDGDRFVSRLLTTGIAILALVTVVLTLSATLLVALYTRGWSSDQKALAVSFAYWCMPQLFFFGLYTLLGQLLNARGSFGPYMWAPVVNNVISIAGLLTFVLLYGRQDATGTAHAVGSWTGAQIALLAGGITLGAVGQGLVLILPLRKLGFRFRPEFGLRGSGLGSAGRVAIWTVASLLMEQTATWVAYKEASSAPRTAMSNFVAGNAAFTNALAVYVIPHSLITVSLTTALFTTMSQAAARGDIPAVRQSLSYGIRTTAVFTLFASVVLMVLARPLCRVVFFPAPASSVEAVAQVLTPLALGLVPLGITLLIKRVFFAFQDGRTVFTFQVPMSLLFIGGCFLSIRLLEPAWWVIGIALSQTLSYIAGSVLRLNSLRYRIGGVDGRSVAWLLLRSGLAAVVAGEIGVFVNTAMPDGASSISAGVLGLVVVGTVMAVVYLFCLHLLRVDELADFLRPFAGRFKSHSDPPARHSRYVAH